MTIPHGSDGLAKKMRDGCDAAILRKTKILKRIITITTFLFLALAMSADWASPQAYPENNYALIIGITNYDHWQTERLAACASLCQRFL